MSSEQSSIEPTYIAPSKPPLSVLQSLSTPLPVPNIQDAEAFSVAPDLLANDGANRGRVRRRSRFTMQEDFIIVREVAIAKLHLAPKGETRERYEIVASKVNATKRIKEAVSWKAVNDRYVRLQRRFDEKDRFDARCSGVGGEISEPDELLGDMGDSRRTLEDEKNSKRQRILDQEEEKERIGAVIKDRATKRKSADCSAEETVVIGIESDGSERATRKIARRGGFASFGDEAAAFTAALERGDAARHELEKERLKLDREKFEEEGRERGKEREICKEKRELAANVELEKFKLMLETFARGGCSV